MIFLLYFVILPTKIMIKIILGSILAGFALSLVGTFIVHLKITSVGFAMSHAAFAGAALGLLIASYGNPFDPVFMALIFTVLVSFLLGPLSDKTKLDSNIILGILFSLMIALGFIFISFLPEGMTGQGSMGIIWGSLFGLNEEEMIVLIILNIIIILFIVLFYKELMSIMLNQKIAQAAGINVKLFKFLILLASAIAVSFSIKIVGAFLVYAMIVNPTSTVHQYVYDTKKLFIFSPIIGILSILGGIFLSLCLDFPISSSIIIFSSAIFALSVLTSPKHRKKGKRNNEESQKKKSIETIKNYFNLHAEDWDEEVYHDPLKVKEIINALEIKEQSKILDVGTGTGIMIPYMNEISNNNSKILAIDVSPKMISIAKKKYSKKYSNVDFIVKDISKISDINEFDIILCYSCFPHFLDQQNLVKKITKALKSDGRLMIAHSQSRKFINNLHKNVKNITSKNRLPSLKKLKKMMITNGLEVIKTHDSDEMFYIIGKKN